MRKVGLVLEGGGLHSLYAAGVLDTLMENNVKVNGIFSTETGALFAMNYFSNQKGRALRYNKNYFNDKRYRSVTSLLLTGNYMNKNFAFYKMTEELDQFDVLTYVNRKKSFIISLTNIDDGETEYFDIQNPVEQMEHLRASCAVPFISRIVKIDGKKYLSGNITDPIPLGKAINSGYDKIVIIETQPLNYREKPLKKALLALAKLKYLRYPHLRNCILLKSKKYNEIKDDIVNLEKNNEVFVIRPSKKLERGNKKNKFDYYQNIYDLGVNDTSQVLKELKQYLKSQKQQSKTEVASNSEKVILTENNLDLKKGVKTKRQIKSKKDKNIK